MHGSSIIYIQVTSLQQLPGVGTKNIIPKEQRNKAQRSFQPVKAQRIMCNLVFLISEAQRNFCNQPQATEAQCHSATAKNANEFLYQVKAQPNFRN